MTHKLPLYPLLLQPTLHVKVWGGRRLQTVLHKPLPGDDPYGEAWEMHDTARVVNGALAGLTISELLPEYGAELAGAAHNPGEGMPLLAKLIDASDWLSVQVHPDDEQARQLEREPRGKTEAWYILSAEPGAQLVIGVQPGTTRAEMARAIANHALEPLLVYADVTAGDVLFIPAGTIHALGPGVLVYEIQQSSDRTYRLYDWGRMGLDGRPRPLHIDKGVSVSNVEALPEIRHTAGDKSAQIELVSSPYFTLTLHQLGALADGTLELDTGGQAFHILTCIEGAAQVSGAGERFELAAGATALIPACVGAYSLSGQGRVLQSHI